MSIVGRSKSNKYTKLGKQCISFNLILKRRQLTDKVTVRANIQGVPKTACHYTNLQLPLECLGLPCSYKPGWWQRWWSTTQSAATVALARRALWQTVKEATYFREYKEKQLSCSLSFPGFRVLFWSTTTLRTSIKTTGAMKMTGECFLTHSLLRSNYVSFSR